MSRSIPHPQLVPLTEEECRPLLPHRDPSLSLSDYSQDQIDEAVRNGVMPCDMREYCHNNGIAWRVKVGR